MENKDNLTDETLPAENPQAQQTSRLYKDSLFRTLFGDSKSFLELYNAVADDHFPEDTEVTLCPPNSILARYNDLAFRIGPQLIIFCEHQSTISTNMPLRLLRYLTDTLFSFLLDVNLLYGEKQITIPTPRFYVLYNGEQKLINRVLKLSDGFAIKESEPGLELIAKVVDINIGSGEAALNRSKALYGYSFLIAEVRKNLQSGMTRDLAIVTAIDFCIQQDVLADFLKEHYGEVSKMLNWEYDAEAEKKVLQQEAKQEGVEVLAELIKSGLSLEDALAKAKALVAQSA